MELKQLRQFLSVARTLNFHRAAEQLHIAQPPLSVSIAKLERELGVRLFERHHRGVDLTIAGQAILPLAEEALARAGEIRDAANAVAAGSRGQLKLGFVSSATYGLAPRLVSTFRREHPGVELLLEEAPTIEILSRVQTKSLDVGIVRTPLLEPTELSLESLERDRLDVTAPRDHPLAACATVALEDLKSEPLIMYDRAGVPNMRALVMLVCESAGFLPRVAQSAAQIHTIISLVESGLGIALVPSALRGTAQGRVTFVPCTLAGKPISVGLSMAVRSEDSSRVVANFCETARRVTATET